MTDTTGNNDTWATVGKAATLIGAVVAAIQIFQFAFPDVNRVHAKCSIASIEPPMHDLIKREAITEFRDRLTYSDLPKQSDEIVAAVAKELEAKRFHGSLVDAFQLKCAISNPGSRSAEEVTIESDYKLHFATVDSRPVRLTDGTNLQIPTIPPYTTREVVLAYEGYMSASSDAVRITVRDGQGEFDQGFVAHGHLATIAELQSFMPSWWFWLVGIPLAIFFAGFVRLATLLGSRLVRLALPSNLNKSTGTQPSIAHRTEEVGRPIATENDSSTK